MQKNSKSVELKVYGSIYTQEHNKMPELHFTQNKVIIRKGERFLSEFMLKDTVINRNVGFGHLFTKLEEGD